MGISLQQWRAKIGTFCRNFRRTASSNNLILPSKGLSLALRMVLFSLLLVHCVEPNPGPPKVSPGKKPLEDKSTNQNESEDVISNNQNEPVEIMKPVERVIYERLPDSKPKEECKLIEDEEYEDYGSFEGEAEEVLISTENPAFMPKLSLKMTDIMADIGVTQKMVNRRRRLFLMREKVFTDYSNTINFKNIKRFHFGSQSEGTTTLGMNSDTDMLSCDYDCPVVLKLPDKDPEKAFFLAIDTPNMPAQNCYLQFFRLKSRMPITAEDVKGLKEDIKIDKEGRVLLKHTYDDKRLKELWKGNYHKQGPSRTGYDNFDMVSALHCKNLPEKCQYLFTRTAQGTYNGHWPRKKVLEKAKGLGTFVVPQGHPGSRNMELEWRFSTSEIERLLMFDLNIVQIRTYIILKLIRKSRFTEIVEDRLSTFHLKTALLYTIERQPPDIWQDDNLTQCVIYCLETLQKFVHQGRCPHYTISDVNLFEGKLKKSELKEIGKDLSFIIEEPMRAFMSIDRDKIRGRILDIEKNDLITKTAMYCFYHYCCLYKNVEGKEGLPGNTTKINPLRVKQLPSEILATKSFIMSDKIPNKVLKEILKIQCCFLGSVWASVCIGNKWPLPNDIFIPYGVSLDADLTSCRLKFASMLYCSKQFTLAEQVLTHVESLLHPNMWQWCGCGSRPEIKPTDELVEMIRNLPDIELIDDDGLPMTEYNVQLDIPEMELFKANIARSVKLITLETYCVPKHLSIEKDRTLCDEEKALRHPVDDWMDGIIIDSIPFLYYLQFLTYMELSEQESSMTAKTELCKRKQKALKKLHSYAFDKIGGQGHAETAFNVLGHCYELENNADIARQCYTESLRLYRYNNAANIHMTGLGLSVNESFERV